MGKGALKTRKLAYLLIFAALFSLTSFFSFIVSSQQSLAAPGINEAINFQGRLFNGQGAIVPDGSYNIQFKIYESGSGTTAGNPDGTLLWTENHLNDDSNGVLVKNGYMAVELGAITPFGSLIDWNDDTLWLSINIGNTNLTCSSFASCGPDGEMLPMKRFTATPYSLNSARLGGLTSAAFLQVGQGVQQDANNGSSIFINKTGTGNQLQLQSAGADVFTVQNSGSVLLGSGSDQSIAINTSGAGVDGRDLTITAGAAGSGSMNGGDITINAGAGSGTGSDGLVRIGAESTSGIVIGNTDGASSLTLQSGSGGITLGQSGNSDTQTTLYGKSLIATQGTNSTTALSVQNSSSRSIFSADTTNNQVALGTSGGSGVDGKLVFRTSAGSNTAGISLAANPDASYTLLLPTGLPEGGQCLKAGTGNVYQLSFGDCVTPTTPQFVQQTTNANGGNSTSLTTGITATSAGNLLILQIAVNNQSNSVSSITDNGSNTWEQAARGFGQNQNSEIWFAENAASTTSITVNTSTNSRISVHISEFAGMADTDVLDVAAGRNGYGGTAHTTATITPTVGFDLVVASLAWGSGPTMNGSSTGGWNDFTPTINPTNLSSRYVVPPVAGSIDTSWTSAWYTTSASAIAAFKPVGGGSDYAEQYGTNDASIKGGDVVALDTARPAERIINEFGQDDSKAWIKKASSANRNTMVGVVSTAPNQVIGKVFSKTENPRPVALSGRVPVKVNTENGPIEIGDYLTASSEPGVAMKAVSPGMSVGQALSPYDGDETGIVTLFVKNIYYPGDDTPTISIDTQDSDAPSGISIPGESNNSGTSIPSDSLQPSSGESTLFSDEDTSHADSIQNASSGVLSIDAGSKLITIGDAPLDMDSTGLGDLRVAGNVAIGSGLRIGTNANGYSFSVAEAPTGSNGIYIGATRPTRTIALSPEYPGASIQSQSGEVVQVGFETNNDSIRTFYELPSVQASESESSILVRIPVPRDWSDFSSTPRVCIDTWSSQPANSDVTLSFYDTRNVQTAQQNVTIPESNDWHKHCMPISGTITGNQQSYISLKIDATSALGATTRLGDITIDYRSGF